MTLTLTLTLTVIRLDSQLQTFKLSTDYYYLHVKVRKFTESTRNWHIVLITSDK